MLGMRMVFLGFRIFEVLVMKCMLYWMIILVLILVVLIVNCRLLFEILEMLWKIFGVM